MGRVSGPIGCLPSCPFSSIFTEISGFSIPEDCLRLVASKVKKKKKKKEEKRCFRLRILCILFILDVWFLVAESRLLVEDHLRFLVEVTQLIGFLINHKKSMFFPQRHPTFLGAVLDVLRLLARPVDRRVLVFRSWCRVY